MNYEEIAKQIKEVDNLVSGEGLACIVMINSVNEFDDLYWHHKGQISDSWNFRDSLIRRLDRLDQNTRMGALRQEKVLLLTLMKKSALTDLYFTPYLKDMARRIVELSNKDIYLTLTKYDFVPEDFKLKHTTLHQILIYLVQWREELYYRYSEIIKLEHMSQYEWTIEPSISRLESLSFMRVNNRLRWVLKKRQLTDLLKLFKKYFSRRADFSIITNVLYNPNCDGNIIWVGSTEALVYLFCRLVEHEYILNKNWGMVIMNRLVFCSKQGNIITNRNINATLYRIKHKEITTKEFKLIDRKLTDFKVENGPFGYME
ncbi:hypothetical protein [Spirosoma luteum]|uniref:hypothetical protein n=1 Tax=Spirosoma luteum TaxID=431553 RepID=UPI00036E41ED|nr:hypothetical protein [Spirosoma luteum]